MDRSSAAWGLLAGAFLLALGLMDLPADPPDPRGKSKKPDSASSGDGIGSTTPKEREEQQASTQDRGQGAGLPWSAQPSAPDTSAAAQGRGSAGDILGGMDHAEMMWREMTSAATTESPHKGRYPAAAVAAALTALEAVRPDYAEGNAIRGAVDDALDRLYRYREIETGVRHPDWRTQ